MSDAEAVARRSAAAMWEGDAASRALGMEIVAVGPGTATLRMTVTGAMTNGHGTCHGGYLFTLADSAFGFACNSHGDHAVAQHGAITFVRPGRLGDELVAEARQVSRSGRSGLYDVTVRAAGAVVAEFRGASRTTGGRWVAAERGA